MAAKQELLNDRIPIVWKGKAKDDDSSSRGAEAPDTTDMQPTPEPRPLQRMKPNAAFLLNVVADAQRGNERLCADEATNASLTVLGQVCGLPYAVFTASPMDANIFEIDGHARHPGSTYLQ